jgi:hypothetical protein
MYAYIYDGFTNEPKFRKLLYKIEKRLTDLGLNGKIIRLGVSKNIKSAVEDEIRLGTKTIVAVGDDRTVSQIINVVAGNQRNEKQQITLGIIPVAEEESKIAASFGINSIGEACEILLSRRLETFQLAQINQGFFLFEAILNAEDTILEIDGNYIIQNLKPALIEAFNYPRWPEETFAEKKLKLRISAKDGKSLFFFRDLLIINKNAPLIADGSLEIKTPARIKLSDERIKVIVGKKLNIPPAPSEQNKNRQPRAGDFCYKICGAGRF